MENGIREPLKDLEIMEKLFNCICNPPKTTSATELLMYLRQGLEIKGLICYGAQFLVDGVMTKAKSKDGQEYEVTVKPRKEKTNA